MTDEGCHSGHLVLRFGARFKLPAELWSVHDLATHHADVRVVGTLASRTKFAAAGCTVELRPLSSAILAVLGLADDAENGRSSHPSSALVGVSVDELAVFVHKLFSFTPAPQNEAFIVHRLNTGDETPARFDYLQLAMFLGFPQALDLLEPTAAPATLPPPEPVEEPVVEPMTAPDFVDAAEPEAASALLGFIRVVFHGHGQSLDQLLQDPGALAAHVDEHAKKQNYVLLAEQVGLPSAANSGEVATRVLSLNRWVVASASLPAPHPTVALPEPPPVVSSWHHVPWPDVAAALVKELCSWKGPSRGAAAGGSRRGLKDQASLAMLRRTMVSEQTRHHTAFPLLLQRLCAGLRPSVGELPPSVMVDMRFDMAEQLALVHYSRTLVKLSLSDSPLRRILQSIVDEPDAALDGALSSPERANGAPGRLALPILDPLESVFGLLPVGNMLYSLVLQYLPTGTGATAQAKLLEKVQLVNFISPTGTSDLSLGFNATVTEFATLLSNTRKMHTPFDAKPLAQILVEKLVAARQATVDTEGTWSRFVTAEVFAFHPFRQPRAVYDEESLVSLVKRIMDLATDAAVAEEYFSAAGAAVLPVPKVNVVGDNASINEAMVPNVGAQRADGGDAALALTWSNYKNGPRVHVARMNTSTPISNDDFGQCFACSPSRDSPFVAVALSYTEECFQDGCQLQIPRNMDSCLKNHGKYGTDMGCESVRPGAWVCGSCNKLTGPSRTSCRYRLYGDPCPGTRSTGTLSTLERDDNGIFTAEWSQHERKLNWHARRARMFTQPTAISVGGLSDSHRLPFQQFTLV